MKDFHEYKKASYPVIFNLKYKELGNNILPEGKIEECEKFFYKNYIML